MYESWYCSLMTDVSALKTRRSARLSMTPSVPQSMRLTPLRSAPLSMMLSMRPSMRMSAALSMRRSVIPAPSHHPMGDRLSTILE